MKKKNRDLDFWEILGFIFWGSLGLIIVVGLIFKYTSLDEKLLNFFENTDVFEQNKINYKINLSDNTAVVIESPNASGEINIPSTITYKNEKYKVISIESKAFVSNTDLYKVNISEGIKQINSRAFDNDYILEVSIPNSIEYCSGDSFSQYIQGTLLNGFKYLGNENNPYVVLYRKDLNFTSSNVSISIPEGVRIIVSYRLLLYGATSITLPNSLVYFDSFSLLDSGSGYSVEYSATVQYINIDEDTHLKEYVMDSLRYCNKLKHLYIPECITKLPSNLAEGLESLETINVHPNNSNYISPIDSNVLVEKSTNTLIIGGSRAIIPEGIKEIGQYAFYKKNISSITIPSSVQIVGDYAFFSCQKITNLIIPKSINIMGYGSLESCTGLKKLVLPFVGRSINENEDVNSSLSYVFGKIDGTYIAKFSLPDTKIYIDAKSPIVLKKYSLKVEAYEIYLLSNVSEINENAIYCKVKNVYISNNVRKITGEIFYNDNTGYLGTEITTNVYCESEKIIPGWILTWFNSKGTVFWNNNFESIKNEINNY